MRRRKNPLPDVSRARVFMERGRYLDIAIRSKTDELARLRAIAEGVQSVRYDALKVQGGHGNGMEAALVEYAAYSAEVDAELRRLITIRREISALINAIPDYRYQALLRGVYLCNRTHADMAKELCMTVYHIRSNLLPEALMAVEMILNEREKGDMK